MQTSAPRAVTAICTALQEQIEHGLLAPGCKLPPERTLSEVFTTTRITLREALQQLEAQGLIYREERRGWFISAPRLTYDLIRRRPFHGMVRDQGRTPSTHLLGARLQPAPAHVCEALQLPALSSVIQICRLRRVDLRPVLYVEHYLNPRYFPLILQQDLSHSLSGLYEREYGIEPGQVDVEIMPTALGVEAASALKVSVGSLGLRIARINHDRQGRLTDCDLEYWRHDAIRLSAVVRPSA